METPVVSIIMPAYNAEKTISESIESVLKQSYEKWELIVIDDASSDSTCSVATKFQQGDKRIILLRIPENKGVSNARNEGCKIAKGLLVAFLDSDDLWDKDKLNIQVAFHSRNQEIEISHTDFHFFDEKRLYKRPLKYLMDFKGSKQGLLYPDICYKNTVGILTVMLKKDLFLQMGGFDTSLQGTEDHDLWIRIASKYKKFGYVSKPLAYYRFTAGGLSRRTGKYKLACKKLIRKCLSSYDVSHKLIWRYYYRYFGTTYLKNGDYKLSQLYFCKSIKLVPFDYVAITTALYLTFGLAKEVLQFFRSKAK